MLALLIAKTSALGDDYVGLLLAPPSQVVPALYLGFGAVAKMARVSA
jgi:hypothetical protein